MSDRSNPRIEARAQFTCQICERSGHTAATCRVKIGKTCAYCKTKGHVIEECRKRQYNERIRSGNGLDLPNTSANTETAESSALNQFHPNRRSDLRTLTIGVDNSCGQIPFISFLCHEQRVDIILDSGSQGNVIKFEVLPLNIQINYSDQILLKGISEELLLALGSVHLKIFDQLIKFYVVRNEVQIPRSGILGIEFLSKSNVIIDFDKNNLHIGDHTLPLKKNGYCPINVKVDKIFNINGPTDEQTLPLIDVLNRNFENVGQFLLDTGSEGNLIKISSLPPDCEIDISKKVY